MEIKKIIQLEQNHRTSQKKKVDFKTDEKLLKKYVGLSLGIFEKVMEENGTDPINWKWETKSHDGKSINYKEVFLESVKYISGYESKFDHKKGIIFSGNTGTGKSIIMESLSLFSRKIRSKKAFKFVNVQEVLDNLSSTKNDFDLTKYYNQHAGLICFDEIGEEDISNFFGNKVDPIKRILTQRADRNILTFGTTNLSMDGILKRYGQRLYSRMMHKYTFYYFSGKDMRVNK